VKSPQDTSLLSLCASQIHDRFGMVICEWSQLPVRTMAPIQSMTDKYLYIKLIMVKPFHIVVAPSKPPSRPCCDRPKDRFATTCHLSPDERGVILSYTRGVRDPPLRGLHASPLPVVQQYLLSVAPEHLIFAARCKNSRNCCNIAVLLYFKLSGWSRKKNIRCFTVIIASKSSETEI
jgi:hypothetical protein